MYLWYSNSTISLKEEYSLNFPYKSSMSFSWYLNNSMNPSNPNYSHQPFFSKIANVLLKIFRKLNPPPTLEGNDPSLTKNIIDLVWSNTMNNSLRGSIAYTIYFLSILSNSEIYSQVFSKFSHSSTSSLVEYGPNLSQISLLNSIFNFSHKN